jgi:adenine deaminase
VEHYKLPVGLLRAGDAADFVVVNNLADFDVLQTYIDGQLVAEHGKTLLPHVPVTPINNFKAEQRIVADFAVKATTAAPIIKVIEAIEGQLITRMLQMPAKVEHGNIVSDTERDVLKLVVVNRYEEHAPVAVAFIKNFGLTHGALASTVAHDCHNIICVGVDDAAICTAVNALIDCKGGLAAARGDDDMVTMPLAISGLMSVENGHNAAAAYTRLNEVAKELGTKMHAPFMTLSFMALLVIPALKLSDKGLFDGERFAFTSVEA